MPNDRDTAEQRQSRDDKIERVPAAWAVFSYPPNHSCQVPLQIHGFGDTDAAHLKLHRVGAWKRFEKAKAEAVALIVKTGAAIKVDVSVWEKTIDFFELLDRGLDRVLIQQVAPAVKSDWSTFNQSLEPFSLGSVVFSTSLGNFQARSSYDTERSQDQVAQSSQFPHDDNADVTDDSFDNLFQEEELIAPLTGIGGTASLKRPMSSPTQPYQSSGHAIRFTSEKNEIEAFRVLRHTTEDFCTVAPDLYLFTNGQVAELEKAGVAFEYVSEPPKPNPL